MTFLPKDLPEKLETLRISPQYGLRLLSFLDQGFYSLANFILTLTLARHYPSPEVAGFGIGLSVALILESVQRNTYVLLNSLLLPAVFRRRTDRVIGEHLIVWAVIIAVELVAFTVLSIFFSGALFVTACTTTLVFSLIYAQLTFDRIYFLKHGKYKDPLLMSVAFLMLNIFIFFAAPRWSLPFSTLMLMIGAYAALKTLRLLALTGKPDFFWGWRLAKRDFRKYFMGALFGITGSTGFSNVPLFVLGAVAQPLQAAAFVALRSLLQPLILVIRSLDVIDKNLFIAGASQAPARLQRIFWRQLFLYGLCATATILGTVLFGRSLLLIFYGERYIDFYSVLLGWAVIFSAMTITFPLETIIVKKGRLVQYNVRRLIAGAVGTGLAFLLCPAFGANGAVVASICGWAVSVAFAVWIVRDVLFFRAKRAVVPANR